MKPPLVPVAAEVRQDQESEAALIQRVKQAGSNFSWLVGECASLWTERWAKGRTDEDFAAAVGMTGDQVYQRRRVWDRFGFAKVSDTYRNLAWSHFYAALTWEDADACLQWACDNSASVAEMKAWRSAQSGQPEIPIRIGNSDPFGGDEDPFGEGAEGAGREPEGEDDGTETGGTETAEEESTRPPGSGTEASGGKQKPPKDEFATLKAKTIKAAEMLQRLAGDLNEVHPIPQAEAIRKAASRIIQTLKGVT